MCAGNYNSFQIDFYIYISIIFNLISLSQIKNLPKVCSSRFYNSETYASMLCFISMVEIYGECQLIICDHMVKKTDFCDRRPPQIAVAERQNILEVSESIFTVGGRRSCLFFMPFQEYRDMLRTSVIICIIFPLFVTIIMGRSHATESFL